jgi:hypothetical protein
MNILKRILLLIALTVSGVAASAFAPGDTVISFVNVYPGGIIYELEGHAALRVRTSKFDVAVNFGLFDFETPNFVYRFVKGETDYCVGIQPWQWFEQSYRQQGRRMVAHELNMTGEQKRRLMALLDRQLLPENRTYRYNYVKDNCATRPLRLVELAMGDSILLGKSQLSNGCSFRDVMRHYHANYPWYQFGIDLALGSGIDYTLNNRETAFAPAALDKQLPQATVGGKPLVSRTTALVDTAEDNVVESPTPVLLTPMAVFTLLFIVMALLTVRDIKRLRTCRTADALLYGAFGLVGLLLAFLIFISSHEATSPNYLFAWLNPLCLIPTIFIWLKNGKKIVYCYQIANFALLIMLAIAWPMLPQSANAAFLPLFATDLMRSAAYIYIVRAVAKTNKQR